MKQTVELGSLISPAKTVRCGDGNYPVLSMTMHNGLVFQDKKFKKVIASKDTSDYKVVYRNQLVISFPIDEGVLAAQRITDAGIVSPAYGIWDIDQTQVFPEFLEFALRCNRAIQYYKAKLRGSTARRRSLPTPTLLAFSVPLPNLEEQQEILEKVHKAKQLVALREQELQALDELIKARFVEMFGRAEDRKYPTAKLGKYAKLQGGYAFKSKDFVVEGIPLVQIGNVNRDYLEWDVINTVPEEYLDRYKEYALSSNDLVMAMTRPIIKSLDSVKIAKVAESDLPCLLNQRVGRFQIIEKLHPIYLEMLCKTDDFKKYVERMSGNSLQPNISSKQVEDYIIILPPMDLQEQFATFVAQVDKSKFEVQRSLDKTQVLFDSLMQEYFG